MTTVNQAHPIIDTALDAWREKIGRDFDGYRGHVYRVFNFTCALHSDPAAETTIAVAAVFHDMGIWSDDTFDYIDPSFERAMAYVRDESLSAESESISSMIRLHHKITRCREVDGAITEAFRRADLADLSLGLLGGGLSRRFVKNVRSVFPNNGFHLMLGRVGFGWLLRHPLNPLPMMRW